MVECTFIVHDFDPLHPMVRWREQAAPGIFTISEAGHVSASEAGNERGGLLADYFDEYPLTSEQQRNAEGRLRPATTWSGELMAGNCAVRLNVTELDDIVGGMVFAHLSFNPARLHDPDGWGLCPLPLVGECIRMMLRYLERVGVVTRLCAHTIEEPDQPCTSLDCMTGRQLTKAERRRHKIPASVDWADHLRGVRIQRVDVACDFLDVRRPVLWHELMSGHGSYESLAPGSSAIRTGGWYIRLYDKRLQARRKRLGLNVPENTLRLEVQVRRSVLRNRQIDWPADLAQEALIALFVEGMAKARLDQLVGTPRDGTRRTAGIGDRTRRTLHERWNDRAETGAFPAADPKTQRKYERYGAQCGLVPGHWVSERLGYERHLDPVFGREGRPRRAWKRLHAAGDRAHPL